MREILFKGKRKDNGEWVEGNLVQSKDISVIFPKGALKGKTLFTSALKENGEIEFRYEVNPETVCQYTGLTDKNGRKIFEGDIVKLPKCENDIAVFVLRGCNYFLKGKRSNYELGSCDSECFEVIGNIFDNPELIGDQP